MFFRAKDSFLYLLKKCYKQREIQYWLLMPKYIQTNSHSLEIKLYNFAYIHIFYRSLEMNL